MLHFRVFNTPIEIDIAKNSGGFFILYNQFNLKPNASITTILYFILIFFQALRYNLIMNNNKMYSKQNYTISFSYVLFTSLIYNSYTLSTALITNSLILYLISLWFKLYNNNKPKGLIFNIGFLTSLTTILFYPAFYLIIISVVALGVLRAFKPVEWLIYILALVAPYYIILSILYLFDFNFQNIVIYNPKFFITFYNFNYFHIFNLIFIIVLIVISFLIWYPNSNKLVIQMRKNWIVILFLFLISIFIIPLYNSKVMKVEVLSIIPLSAFLANLFTYPKKQLLINILILISLVFVVYNNTIN